MKMPWVAAGLVGAIAASASADTVYSTLGEWDGSRRSSGFGSVAEIVTVPATDTTLETFSFYTYTESIEASYRVLVYEWNEALDHVVGAAVYESQPNFMPTDTFALQDTTIGMDLVAEAQYALIVQFDAPSDGTGSAFVRDSSFDGFLAATSGAMDQAWSVFGGSDLAFEATFSGASPAPSALALLGLGALLGSGRRRR